MKSQFTGHEVTGRPNVQTDLPYYWKVQSYKYKQECQQSVPQRGAGAQIDAEAAVCRAPRVRLI